MKKDELLHLISNSEGTTRSFPASSKEEGEEIITMAKHLEHDGKIVLIEYCLENKPPVVSLKAKLVD